MAIGFAFGGGGWLTLWYLGVLAGLTDSGALVPGVTPVGGTSAGAHAAAVACGAGNLTAVKEAALRAAAECEGDAGDAARRIPCRWRMDDVARVALRESIPPGSHARCSRTLTLGLTRARVQPGGDPQNVVILPRSTFTVRQFDSDDDLIDAASASGYLPCISGPGPFARYKVGDTIAGGYSYPKNYVCPRGVSRCITVHSGPRGWLFAPETGGRRRRELLDDGAGGSVAAGGAAGVQDGSGSTQLWPRGAEPAKRRLLAGAVASSANGSSANVTGCEILNSVPTPVVYFPWDMDKIKIHIYPGKYNRVQMPWSQWQSLVLHPNVVNLTYAYELGMLDGKAWAAENHRLWNRTRRPPR